MALRQRGAHEEESIHRRADGRDPARGRPQRRWPRRPRSTRSASRRSTPGASTSASSRRRTSSGCARSKAENARLKEAAGRARTRHRRCSRRSITKVVSPQARREQVAFACERGLSERRACGLLGIARSTLSYELRLPAKDAPVIEPMKQLSAQYPRYGYRRIRIFLRRQGHQLGSHRAHRLWRQAGLQLPRRRPRRRIATGRPRPLPASRRELRLGLRLRLRRLRQRPAAQVPDGRRRVHPRMPGHRRGRLDPLQARDRGALAPRQHARRAALPALGQRPGVRQPADPRVARRRAASTPR